MKHTCGKDGDPGAVTPLDGHCDACDYELTPWKNVSPTNEARKTCRWHRSGEPVPGFMPCTRDFGHDGPCAMHLDCNHEAIFLAAGQINDERVFWKRLAIAAWVIMILDIIIKYL